MKKKLQVFISSTYTDLIEERQAAVEAILKAGHIPAGMELFNAGNESQLESVKRWIDESDVYLLILGGRYGSLEPKTGKSYTHLEYEYALDNGLPIFSVVIKDIALEKKVKEHGKNVLELENPDKYKELKELVLTKISRFFNDSKDITIAIHETLSDFQKRYEFKGWISGKDIPNVEGLLTENAKLVKENARLKLKNEKQNKTSEKNNALINGHEFSVIMTSLKSTEVGYQFEDDEEESVLNVFDIPLLLPTISLQSVLVTELIWMISIVFCFSKYVHIY